MKEEQRTEEEQKELRPFLQRWLVAADDKLRTWAERLGAKTNGYSTKKKKRFLFGFCLLLAALSSYTIVQSVEGKLSPLKITPIHTMPIIKPTRIQPTIGEKELTRIHRYKQYLDSLSGVQGAPFLDSFSALHPRLLDTLNYLETIYQQQLKTK